jgi:hypothetical protein
LAEQNPFQPPSEKPASDAHLTDQQRLALPESARARHAFGDRYFWGLVLLIGVFLVVVGSVLLPIFLGIHWLLLDFVGAGLVLRALIGWVRREGD